MNPLQALASQGQSIWLDYIRRGMTRSGELARLVREDGVRGVTSNPAIFKSSIAGSEDYREAVQRLVADPSLDAMALYEKIAIEDIQDACDALRPVFDEAKAADGHVSFEVAPGWANDTAGTIAEARRLWAAVDRPNLMVKVPGTPEGIVALERLIADGININMTLIFSVGAYVEIAKAHARGLAKRVQAGKDIAGIASVASFFISRIDVEVDKRLTASSNPKGERLFGRVAIANAKVAYEEYGKLIANPEWKALAAKGAQPQRLLWASTGTKNPAYSDVLYVDELIGDSTVNTCPPKTVDAFRDHGKVAATLGAGLAEAKTQLATLAELGISLDEVTDLLLERGLELFSDAMDSLLTTVAEAQRKGRGTRLNSLNNTLPAALQTAYDSAVKAWDGGDNTSRLWQHDASLWTGGPEAQWCGWLDIVPTQQAKVDELNTFAADIHGAGFKHVLLLGMGGSSLCPDVLAKTFGSRTRAAGKPSLGILDSTVPAQVLRLHRETTPEDTLFIVASKSGSTLEPTVFMESFLAASREQLGDKASQHFVAITDPGSKLEAFAKEHNFRKVLHGIPEIGGRFSAFSHFGMVPAAVMGIDVAAFLSEANTMVTACRANGAASNPAVALGLLMGTAANAGRNKLTVLASPAIASFGAWLEQLIVESTGKQGKAVIVVDGEQPAAPDAYGSDRLFVYLRLRSTPDPMQDQAARAWADAGHPVVHIDLDDIDALPQEFFRWQVATAVAGSVMKVNPFDQPDVEASKIATKAVTAAFEKTGALPQETPVFTDANLDLYADAANAEALGKHSSLEAYLRAHTGRADAGTYFAILAYIDMNAANDRVVQHMRHAVRDRKKVATCVGFGPRFLHSTGQGYKGGPNTGVFIQVTSEDAHALDIPGRKTDFGVVKAAQAAGDLQVLRDRGRAAVRVHIRGDLETGLNTLCSTLLRALQSAE